MTLKSVGPDTGLLQQPMVDVARAFISFALLAVVPGEVYPTVARCWGDVGQMQRLEVEMTAFAVGCAVVCLGRLLWGSPGNLGRLLPRSLFLGYALLLPLWLLFAAGWLRLLRSIDVGFVIQGGLRYFADSAADPASVGFWLVVLDAPVAEEWIFRCFLQRGLGGWLRPWPAILVTAALFGAVHPQGTRMPIVVLGAFFGWLRYRSDGLLAPVVAHMLHNAVMVFVVFCWPDSLRMLYPD